MGIGGVEKDMLLILDINQYHTRSQVGEIF